MIISSRSETFRLFPAEKLSGFLRAVELSGALFLTVKRFGFPLSETVVTNVFLTVKLFSLSLLFPFYEIVGLFLAEN